MMFLAKGGNKFHFIVYFYVRKQNPFSSNCPRSMGLAYRSREKLYKKNLFHNIEREINYVILIPCDSSERGMQPPTGCAGSQGLVRSNLLPSKVFRSKFVRCYQIICSQFKRSFVPVLIS